MHLEMLALQTVFFLGRLDMTLICGEIFLPVQLQAIRVYLDGIVPIVLGFAPEIGFPGPSLGCEKRAETETKHDDPSSPAQDRMDRRSAPVVAH
jgi:hypothetical protein